MPIDNSELARLRNFHKVSQYELGKRLGRPRGWVSQVEQGLIDIKASDMQKWLVALAGEPTYPTKVVVTVRKALVCPQCGALQLSENGLELFIPTCGHFQKI